MAALAFLLMAPWLLVLSFIYWRFLPASLPRPRSRRVFDTICIALALGVGVLATALPWLGWHPARIDEFGHHAGDMWPYLIAVVYAYAGFIAILFPALILRFLIWRRRGA